MSKKCILRVCIVFVCLFAWRCRSAEERRATKHAEKTPVFLARLDIALFASPLGHKELLDSLKKALPFAYQDYFKGIVRLGNPDDSTFSVQLAGFRNDFYMKQLYEKALQRYGTGSAPFKKLMLGLGRYNYYFPKKIVPRVVVCISALNYAAAVNDSTLFVGIDMYLGQDFEAYLAMNMPAYIRKRREPEFLHSESLRAWLLTEFPMTADRPTFSENLIYHGRLMTILRKILPDEKPYYIMGYTKEQWDFCEKNLRNIWQYFVDAGLLQSRESRDVSRYFEEAPFSYGMPSETPGRTGIWLGWKIVENYLDQHPQVTLDSLMKIQDLQTIFLQSGFRP
ncbi:MAG: hypothetical protein N2050_08805 [Flavobacteriales bacterium]|nr:hypothetical protein [Flavobacteriales bacterium]